MLTYPQENPDFGVALSTSLVLFGFDGSNLQVLLARSNRPPYQGALFLPSRYLNKDDELMLSARKMFEQLFGYEDPAMIEQLQAFGKVFRHPGGRVINVAHYALVRKGDFQAEKWDKHDMQWVSFSQVPDLAFDHNEIVEYAKERLKRRVKRRPVGFKLLPDEFTLGQLQNLYETALGKSFDKRNFRKKLFKTTLLINLERKADGTAPGQHKGSQLFSFNAEKYQKMKIQGYDFLF
jgi:8-oxo-dGTP diphosphatase